MADEIDDFGAEMNRQGVKRLPNRQGRVVVAPNTKRDLNKAARRAAAVSNVTIDTNLGSYGAIEWLGPHEVVEFKGEGIQHQAFKNLRQGRYEIGATLDLHGTKVDEARVLLSSFLMQCQQQSVQCALIVHGKGWHSSAPSEALNSEATDKQVSRIKSHVAHWLKSVSGVLAFSSAQARDGGTGALYVLLKKSARRQTEDLNR